MASDIRTDLRAEFLRQAEVQRERSAQTPDDFRYEEAANIFEKMAASVPSIEQIVLQPYKELFDDLADKEAHSELIREVGFSWWPHSADEFCRRFITERTGSAG